MASLVGFTVEAQDYAGWPYMIDRSPRSTEERQRLFTKQAALGQCMTPEISTNRQQWQTYCGAS